MRPGYRYLLTLATLFTACAAAALGALPATASAQTAPGAPQATNETASYDRSPVTLDGEVLFYVRGVTAYPAQRRAKEVAQRIRAFAADRTSSPDSIRAIEEDNRTILSAPGHHLMSLFDEDGAVEGVNRQLLAEMARLKIADAVKAYRADRTARTLLGATVYALGATALFVILLLITIRLFRRLRIIVERRFKSRIEGLAEKSGHAVRTEAVLVTIRSTLSVLRVLAIFMIVYSYLNFTLVLYPWTRPLSKRVFAIVIDPLRSMGNAFIDALPGLVFIAILWIVTRYILKIVRYFFAGIASGRITLANFYPEWAWPTYRIVTILVIAFAVVVSYPYIPGSSSGAFKGVSLLLGLVFSLGSSATIGNMVAGYSLTYRRAFKIGDRVRINDIEGDVSETGVLVTHLRTIKNEDILIPNSIILSSSVVNFSKHAREEGLILHTTVGIGYETSWRQGETFFGSVQLTYP